MAEEGAEAREVATEMGAREGMRDAEEAELVRVFSPLGENNKKHLSKSRRHFSKSKVFQPCTSIQIDNYVKNASILPWGRKIKLNNNYKMIQN